MASLKDKDAAKEILKSGMTGEFWGLICETLSASKAALEEQSKDLRDLPAEEYKIMNELRIQNIDSAEAMMKLPQSIIDSLGTPEQQEEKDHDPYD